MVLNLQNPKDVRNYIQEFIVSINSGELDIPKPAITIQALHLWLKCWTVEQDVEIVKRLEQLERKVQEGRQLEKEYE